MPLFLEVGRLFEERSSLGARAAIDGIRALAARQATRWRDGVEELVDPAQPAAGRRDPGAARASASPSTEPCSPAGRGGPIGGHRASHCHEDVGPGSPVFAGTLALDGLLRVHVRGTGRDTVLGRVVSLLADVERASVPVLRLFERRAGVWLPLVLTLAATTLFFTPGPLARDRGAGRRDADRAGRRRASGHGRGDDAPRRACGS